MNDVMRPRPNGFPPSVMGGRAGPLLIPVVLPLGDQGGPSFLLLGLISVVGVVEWRG